MIFRTLIPASPGLLPGRAPPPPPAAGPPPARARSWRGRARGAPSLPSPLCPPGGARANSRHYLLEAVLCEADPARWRLVASDNRRLAVAEVPLLPPGL